MPSIELTDEELQGFIQLCATASGPGISWMLTNALLNKARVAQERNQANAEAAALSSRPGTANHPAPLEAWRASNSQDHDAKA